MLTSVPAAIALPVAIALLAALSLTTMLLAAPFSHPGGLSSQAELDFVKSKIRAGEQPWKSEFDRLLASGDATATPRPLTHVNSDDNNRDARLSKDDAIAAYSLALLWYFSGDEIHATRALAILNAWSNLQAFTAGNQQDRLQAAWVGANFAHAAEIMRTHPAWKPAEIAALQSMLRRAFYPQLSTPSTWNGNVDLTQIEAMLAIAVFNDDRKLFDDAILRLRARILAYFYLASDGPTPKPIAGDNGDVVAFWFKPLKFVDGLTQETCRDNGHHAQFGLGSALRAAEIAWHQGVDVYSEHQPRLTAAMELLAQQFLSNSMNGLTPNNTPTPNRFNTFEIGYHHYHTRAGIDLPHTRKLILEQIRPRSLRAVCNLAHETLTHADLPRPPN